jgi:LmbE family N-acetylglucosaminyl deacetylase
MVFAPHPDDDLIGCGGSLIKHVRNGRNVTVVYMTSGDAGSRSITKRALGEVREKEAQKACEFIGIKDLVFLRNRDGYLENNERNFVRVVNLLREKQPSIIYMPHENDGHPDHVTTHRIASRAMTCAAGPWFQETVGSPWSADVVLGYEVWSPIPDPGYIEDTTEVIDQQLAALAFHESQLGDVAYDHLVRSLHGYRGFMLGGSSYAEAFSVIRMPASSVTA